MKKLDKLPVFNKKNPEDYEVRTWRLRVDGLVEKSLVLTYKDIVTMPSTRMASDFSCVEGWTVENIKWEGVSIRELIALARPEDSARFVTFHAGEFASSLALEEARRDNVILAYRMDGIPLPADHGGPYRLIAPGRDCFYGVKWVDRLEVSETDGRDTGPAIALERIRRK